MSKIYSYQSGHASEKVIKLRQIHQCSPADEKESTSSEQDELESLQLQIDTARKELEQLVEQQKSLKEDAAAEIATAKENWQLEREQLVQQAQLEGFNEGFASGKLESTTQYKELLDEANQIIASAKKDYHTTIEQSEDAILELAVVIAGKIMTQKLNDSPEMFVPIVKEAIRGIKDQSTFTLYVHPDSYDLVSRQKEEIARLVDRDASITVFVKEDLKESSCIIEHPFGRVDAGIDTQLQQIREALHEVSMENEQ